MEVHEIIVLFIPTLRVVQGGGGKRVDLIRAACSLTKSCLVKLPGGRSRLISFQHCRQYDGDNHHSHPTLEVISKKISYKARVIRPLHQLLHHLSILHRSASLGFLLPAVNLKHFKLSSCQLSTCNISSLSLPLLSTENH